jgi:hypothetical protein
MVGMVFYVFVWVWLWLLCLRWIIIGVWGGAVFYVLITAKLKNPLEHTEANIVTEGDMPR